MIKVGKMPTLAHQASAEPPLLQHEGSTRLVSIEKPKPRCASCQG
jgi:hypothetical protein